MVLLKGFGQKNQAALIASQSVGAITEEKILPYGEAEFSAQFKKTIKSRSFLFNVVEFKKLDAESEVGKPVQNLITPLQTK